MRHYNFLSLILLSLFIASCSKPLTAVPDYSTTYVKAGKEMRELDDSVDVKYNSEPNVIVAVNDNTTYGNETVLIRNIRIESSDLNRDLAVRYGITTKYLDKDGRPEWLRNPNIVGYRYTAIGSSIKHDDGINTQKQIAQTYAFAELSKTVKVAIDNELDVHSITRNAVIYKQNMTVRSRQTSSELIDKQVLIDEWIDPHTGEYFLIIGVPEQE